MVVTTSLRPWTEDIARQYLEPLGWYVRHTWWEHSGQHLDMVCIDNDMTTLLFVCLYQQQTNDKGLHNIHVPAFLLPIATTYIHDYHLEHLLPQFDSITVIGSPDSDSPPTLRHKKNILTLKDPYAIYDKEKKRNAIRRLLLNS